MKESKHIHFVGIGGYGMSSLARVLMDMGHSVSGSDIKASSRTGDLAAAGARVYIGHDASHVSEADLVVISVAVPEDNVEVRAAKARGVPVITRAQMLGRLMDEHYSIAITGSHGKTTTTSMIAFMLQRAGLDPTVLVGGELSYLGGGGRLGRGRYLVAEADEAYGSFLELRPTIAVVTNIDNDHLDYYGNVQNLVDAFRRFLLNADPRGAAVLCADDERIERIAGEVASRIRVVTYGIRKEAMFMAREISITGLGSTFQVVKDGKVTGRVELKVPGRHNIYNALACCSVGMEIGLGFDIISEALALFKGAKRRCQFIGEKQGILVLDDYAHHPTEIKATLEALKEGSGGRRLVVVFQPQRFTRTQLLMDEFARAFSAADVIVINDIYHEGTGEKPIPGVTGEALARAISEFEGREVIFVPQRRDIAPRLLKITKSGDLVVTMGAGDIWLAAREFVDLLEECK
ncbi:MAG TPA: UDP-N-acetylmuramate--L-alanine ligase [Firmicutes bacterium]|nr:UDP-N-acetylmuramate--L-alanine ligase [Bacillota bacterium]